MRSATRSATCGLQPEPAIDVVDDDRSNQRKNHQREEEPEDKSNEGIGEHVERHVEPKLWIADAKVGRVAPREERRPLPLSGHTSEEAQDSAYGDRDDASIGRQRHAIAIQTRLLGS